MTEAPEHTSSSLGNEKGAAAVNTYNVLKLTSEIVCAYLSKNTVPSQDLPNLIKDVYSTLSSRIAGDKNEEQAKAPAVPIAKSVHHDYIICLEDGKKLKTLKRHLQSKFGLTPEQYRAKWGLPPTYPMVAPAYAEKRSQLAKTIGLGRKPKQLGNT